jgi:protein SCO1/2
MIGMAIIGLLYLLIIPRVSPLPTYMALPSLILVDQEGKSFDLDQTRGSVVVLSPIYTHCPDVCLLTTANMKQIYDRISQLGLENQVFFVSVSIDPQRDHPDVLYRFAKSFKVDFGHWVFLTGSQEQIDSLAQTLGVYVERVYYIDKTPIPETALTIPVENIPYLVNHTDRIFLIDREGNVRALPPGSRADVDETVGLIKALVKEAGAK